MWRRHFSALGETKDLPAFDRDHFDSVSRFVKDYNKEVIVDDLFLIEEFSVDEIRTCIRTLNRG